MLRLAKCCRPVPGDPIVGYISLGRGITIHREDCPNAAALRKDPERFSPVHWEGDHETAFRVEIQVDAWDRHRLLEDLSRTFAEAGINILEARCIGRSARWSSNRFVVEVADTQALKATRHAPAQHRGGVRRLPRDARRRVRHRTAARGPSSGTRASGGQPQPAVARLQRADAAKELRGRAVDDGGLADDPVGIGDDDPATAAHGHRHGAGRVGDDREGDVAERRARPP